MSYKKFLQEKIHTGCMHGFKPKYMPDMLYDFQKDLVRWACQKGRALIAADCGLGKTFMQLAFAENVVRKTNSKVLILTPLAVAYQTVDEAKKLGLEAEYCRKGIDGAKSKIIVTNYERLNKFDRDDFKKGAVVLDESSILKNFNGVRKSEITQFMRKIPYRLLCTATAAPNDYLEIGTSSEALGEMGYTDVVSKFFKKVEKTYTRKDEHRGGVYRFRGHAERSFWRWVCSFTRALRMPSDMGYENGAFVLPKLNTREYMVESRTKAPGLLFDLPAQNLQELREELRRTVDERCEKAASLHNAHKGYSVAWCYLNDESTALKDSIKGGVQLTGSDRDEVKEEKLLAFSKGQIKTLITKPKIAGFGMNWQHSNMQTFFPSHSYEQWYQSVRRMWRFGQKNEVTVSVISSEGQYGVLQNLKRKAEQVEVMFKNLIELMNDELKIKKINQHTKKEEVPAWL